MDSNTHIRRYSRPGSWPAVGRAAGWAVKGRRLGTHTAQALTTGQLSVAHAAVLAAGTSDLPQHAAAKAEPVLVEAASRRLDPPRLRQVLTHLGETLDPEAAATTLSGSSSSGGCG